MGFILLGVIQVKCKRTPQNISAGFRSKSMISETKNNNPKTHVFDTVDLFAEFVEKQGYAYTQETLNKPICVKWAHGTVSTVTVRRILTIPADYVGCELAFNVSDYTIKSKTKKEKARYHVKTKWMSGGGLKIWAAGLLDTTDLEVYYRDGIGKWSTSRNGAINTAKYWRDQILAGNATIKDFIESEKTTR